MKLLELQRALRDRLLDDDLDHEDSSPGVQVYRNAYRARLMDALHTSFARTLYWIGDEAFATAATDYVINHPPHSWTLDDYGEAFPDALATLFANDPEVGELAWLEWYLQRAFAALDGPVLDANGMAAQTLSHAGAYGEADCDWDTLTFELVSSFAERAVHTQCAALWRAIADETAPPSVMRLQAPAHLIVWRQGYSPHFKVVDAAERAALDAIANGCTFGELCARHAAEIGDTEAVTKIGTWLGQWIGVGLLAQVGTAPVADGSTHA